MSAELMAPECQKCGEKLCIHFSYVLIHEDGNTSLVFVYDCDHCASLRIPTKFVNLQVPLSFEATKSLLEAGYLVLKEGE